MFPFSLWGRVLSGEAAKRVRGIFTSSITFPSPGLISLRSISPPSPTRGEGRRSHAALAGGARSLKSGDSRSLGSVMVCSFSSVMPGIISTT